MNSWRHFVWASIPCRPQLLQISSGVGRRRATPTHPRKSWRVPPGPPFAEPARKYSPSTNDLPPTRNANFLSGFDFKLLIARISAALIILHHPQFHLSYTLCPSSFWSICKTNVFCGATLCPKLPLTPTCMIHPFNSFNMSRLSIADCMRSKIANSFYH